METPNMAKSKTREGSFDHYGALTDYFRDVRRHVFEASFDRQNIVNTVGLYTFSGGKSDYVQWPYYT